MAKPMRLSHENLIKLSDWLRAKKESLSQLPHTYKELAAAASRELGFPIADSSIERTASLLGITIKTASGKGGGKQASLNTARLNKLREYVVLLYQKVGEPTPEEIGVNW